MHEWISSHLMDDCTKTINYFFCTIHHMRELGSCYFSPYEPGRVTYFNIASWMEYKLTSVASQQNKNEKKEERER